MPDANTRDNELSATEEHEFGVWSARQRARTQRDPLAYMDRHDVKGWWKANGGMNAPDLEQGESSQFASQEGIFDKLKGMFGGAGAPKEISGKSGSVQYPTSEEADKAIESGIGYGTPHEDYINNQTARVLGRNFQERASATIEGGRLTSMQKEGTGFAPIESPSLAYVTSEKAFKDNPTRAVENLDPETQKIIHNVFARAALAVGRDPIASIGFDPKNTLINVLTGRINKAAVAGQTDEGRMYTNVHHQETSTVHESIHNGLEKLQNGLYKGDDETPAKYKEIINKHLNRDALTHEQNELVVRQLMRTVVGLKEAEDPTANVAKQQIADAKYRFEESPALSGKYSGMLKDLQNLAASAIARKHPMGPR